MSFWLLEEALALTNQSGLLGNGNEGVTLYTLEIQNWSLRSLDVV